jgi:protein-S-isoprenylcysteine O-methyltransferase Ste14
MDIEQYYRYYLAGVYGLMLIIRLIYGSQANRQGGKPVSRREPGWSPILMGLLMVLSNGVLLLAIFWPEALHAAAIPASEGWRWLGLVLGLCMDALFFWIHHMLGRNWAVGVLVKEHRHLVMAGPYRWVRHPMYSALFGFSVAFFLLSANLLVGLLWLAMTVASAWRVAREEQILTETFGLAYQQYAAQTGRFLPKRWGLP